MSNPRTPAERSAHRKAVIRRARLQLRRAWRHAVIVALTGIIAVLSAGALVRHISGGSPLTGRTVIHVAVDDAKGVVPAKNEVRWAGVVVGRITATKMDNPPTPRVVLTAEVDPAKTRPLYRNARLRLRPQTALNDMYLDIEDPGTPGAGRLGSGEILTAARTRTPVDLAEVLNVFSTDVRDRLEQALDELSVGLPDGGAHLRQAFAQAVPLLEVTHRLGGAIARRRRVTRQLVSQMRVITDELAARDEAITSLVRSAGATFAELGARRSDIDRLLRQLPPTLTQMHSSFAQLQATLADTRPTLAALRPAVRRLPAGLHALDAIATHADPALAALHPAVRALQPLAHDLAPTAQSLATAFDRLEPQLPRLDRITANLSRCELPVQKFFAYTMSTLKFGNRDNLTSSPRGLFVASAAEATNGVDPNLIAAIGCADGRPPR